MIEKVELTFQRKNRSLIWTPWKRKEKFQLNQKRGVTRSRNNTLRTKGGKCWRIVLDLEGNKEISFT